MFFYAEAVIADTSERCFYVKRLNEYGLTPMIFGDAVRVGTTDASQHDVSFVMTTYDSLPNKKQKNEFKFTLAPNRLP